MAIHVSLVLLMLVSRLTHSTLISSVPHRPPLDSLNTTATPGNHSDLKLKDIQLASVKLIIGHKAIATNGLAASMYFATLLILTSCDIELNPGPATKFPCGVCDRAVRWVDKGICCDSCQTWYHISCQGMPTQMYNILGASSISWECLNCGIPNFSSGIFDTFNLSTYNPYTALSDSDQSQMNFSIDTDRSFGPPITSSSPKPPAQTRSKSRPPLRILTLNCQSLVNKRADFSELVDRTNPDIIVGTESWLTPDHFTAEFFPPSYNVHRRDRLDNRGGGVFLAVRNTLTSSTDPTLEVNAELLWCTISLEHQKSLTIGAFYRPPNTGAEVLDQLHLSLSRFANNCSKVIMLAGDFNLPDIDWTIPTIKNQCRTPAIHNQLLNTLADHSLSQLNQTATRENNILDLITTNSPNLVNRIEILPGISDHHAIFTEVDTKPLVGKKQRRSRFLHNRTNRHELRHHLQTFADRFEHSFQTATVGEMWDALRATIDEGMHKYVPTKTIKPHDQLPWITRTDKSLIKKRNKAYCTMKRQPTPENISKFKAFKRKAQHSIRHSYEQYLTDIVNPTVDHGNKKLWSLIRAKRRDTTGVAPLKENGELIQQPLDKANVLNRQFKSAFSPITTEPLPDMGESPYPLMQNITVTVPGVEQLLLNLQPYKAAGPDAILPRTLKDFATEIAPVLTIIFNKSLSSSTIPDDWRTANVTPIFKKGERYLPSNYRPISLTCICCKVQEHIIVSNIMAHLDKHSILYRWQYGFRAKHSTDTQLTTFVHELSQNLDQRKQTDVIILDFSKAFDKVSHKHLALKLQYYGINKIVLDWINSFLTSRTQRVILDGATSDRIQVTSGVPQ